MAGQVFTGTITNSSLSINTDNGIAFISIRNQSTSSGPITVTGTLAIGAVTSTPISVAVGDIVTISAGGGVIGSLVITAGAGESVDIIASQ